MGINVDNWTPQPHLQGSTVVDWRIGLHRGSKELVTLSPIGTGASWVAARGKALQGQRTAFDAVMLTQLGSWWSDRTGLEQTSCYDAMGSGDL
jgi:hypothetical protein